MHPTRRLDTPPPASRFRRPGSPEPFDPNPRTSADDAPHSGPFVQHGFEQRREPSESSYQALDLADYARTLARTDAAAGHAPVFQPVFQAYDSYPPSPQPFRPLASRTSFSPPPVLSPSSSTSHSSQSSPPFRPQRAHQPFSLPPPTFSPPQIFDTLHSHPSLSLSSQSSRPTHDHDPLLTPPDLDQEVDIAQFPRFARGWYKDPQAGYFTSKPTYASPDIDPFDPAYTREHGTFPSLPPSYSSPHLESHSHASRSSRDLVPWGPDTVDGAPVDEEIKAERLRILEREFGGKNAQPETDDEHRIGSVDAKGKLITEGPKKRTAVRVLEVPLSLLAAGSGIYSAAFIKTSSRPPPAGSAQAYALYVVSVITFLLTTYLYLIYPTCCGNRPKKNASPFTEGPGGMMVLPVPSAPGGKKKGKKGKRGKGEGGGEGVQVNLIVDPGMFGGSRREEEYSEEEEDDDSEYTIPGSFGSGRRGRRRGGRHRRRTVFEGLALEARWKKARKRLKWYTLVDAGMLVLWGALFVFILIGKRCPSGSFDGWCDAYNLATAASCLVCFAYGFSIFFAIKDLHASKASPRTRA